MFRWLSPELPGCPALGTDDSLTESEVKDDAADSASLELTSCLAYLWGGLATALTEIRLLPFLPTDCRACRALPESCSRPRQGRVVPMPKRSEYMMPHKNLQAGKPKSVAAGLRADQTKDRLAPLLFGTAKIRFL